MSEKETCKSLVLFFNVTRYSYSHSALNPRNGDCPVYMQQVCTEIRMRSDAGKPCSTCVKAHAHKVAPLMVKVCDDGIREFGSWLIISLGFTTVPKGRII